jgi:hypothetical protein
MAVRKVEVALICCYLAGFIESRRDLFPYMHHGSVDRNSMAGSTYHPGALCFQRGACAFRQQRLQLRGGTTAMTDEDLDALKHVRNVEMQAALGGFFDQKAESDDSSSWPTMYVCHKVTS